MILVDLIVACELWWRLSREGYGGKNISYNDLDKGYEIFKWGNENGNGRDRK